MSLVRDPSGQLGSRAGADRVGSLGIRRPNTSSRSVRLCGKSGEADATTHHKTRFGNGMSGFAVERAASALAGC
jgi:hypothetical protein